MSIFAIGDIQGCYDDFMKLLYHVKFDPSKHKLWIAGDLVNRGPQSLETLRFLKGLGKRAKCVLGNHDLHLLAISEGNLKHQSKDQSLQPILEAPDREELLYWLRHQPLMVRSKKYNMSMVHAGIAPQWSTKQARKYAKEVEATLQGEHYREFLQRMYGNKPDEWVDSLFGMDRLRYITNAFTRMRYCDPQGRLLLKEKSDPNHPSKNCIPWFKVPHRASQHERILFGHWSMLGYHHEGNIWSLDSGCLWGGQLSALHFGKRKLPKVIQIDCVGHKKPT